MSSREPLRGFCMACKGAFTVAEWERHRPMHALEDFPPDPEEPGVRLLYRPVTWYIARGRPVPGG